MIQYVLEGGDPGVLLGNVHKFPPKISYMKSFVLKGKDYSSLDVGLTLSVEA